jgi:hypothetical protein
MDIHQLKKLLEQRYPDITIDVVGDVLWLEHDYLVTGSHYWLIYVGDDEIGMHIDGKAYKCDYTFKDLYQRIDSWKETFAINTNIDLNLKMLSGEEEVKICDVFDGLQNIGFDVVGVGNTLSFVVSGVNYELVFKTYYISVTLNSIIEMTYYKSSGIIPFDSNHATKFIEAIIPINLIREKKLSTFVGDE